MVAGLTLEISGEAADRHLQRPGSQHLDFGRIGNRG